MRRPPIIAIEEGDNFTAAFRDAGVKRGGLASVGFANQAHAGLKSANEFRRSVGRAVVDNQDFDIIQGHVLIEDAGDGALDKTLVVVRVD